MNTCTYKYRDYKNGSISETTFNEDDFNEINWFFESDYKPTSIVSVKINGQDVSLDEARYVVFCWENRLLLKYGTIDEETYKGNIKFEAERIRKKGVDIDKWNNF